MKKNQLETFETHSLMYALEPRIMYDAAGIATGAEAAADAVAQDTADAVLADEGAQPDSLADAFEGSESQEIAFIDGAVDDIEAIKSGLSEDCEVVVLDSAADGVAQMVAALSQRTGLDAIHIISHGTNGSLTVGTTNLSSGNLESYADGLSAIGDALSADGDILLYGCDISGSDAGEAFVDSFAEYTGADVAASDDVTGGDAVGGDWQLEYTAGDVEVSTVLDANGLATYGYALSSVAQPEVNGLDASTHYVLEADAKTIDSNVTFSEGSEYDGGYIEFAVGSSEATDVLSLQTDDAASTSDGVVTIVGSTVYRGNGAEAQVIGTVDSTYNGQNGNNLRINFSNQFSNGDFEDGSVGDTTINGWTVVKEQIHLNGTDTIAGKATPQDTTWPAANESRNLYDNSTWGAGEPARTVELKDDGGDLVVSLNTGGISLNEGYGILRGPYMYSNDTVTLAEGDDVSFAWKATGAGDAYDAYGYLLNVNTGATINLLDSTGASGGTSTAWATETVTIGSGQEGSYRYVFVCGSFDASGGQYVGGELLIDDVSVTQANPPAGVTDSDVTAVAQRVQYKSTLTELTEATTKTITVTAKNSSSEGARTVSDTIDVRLLETEPESNDVPPVVETGGDDAPDAPDAPAEDAAPQGDTNLITDVSDGGGDTGGAGPSDGAGPADGGFDGGVELGGGNTGGGDAVLGDTPQAAETARQVESAFSRIGNDGPATPAAAPAEAVMSPAVAQSLTGYKMTGVNAFSTAPESIFVDKGIPDTAVPEGASSFEIPIPDNAFRSMQGGQGNLSFDAALADGKPLPSWLKFNPETQSFIGEPPAGAVIEDMSLRVVVKDAQGNKAVALFKIFSEKGKKSEQGNGEKPANDQTGFMLPGEVFENGQTEHADAGKNGEGKTILAGKLPLTKQINILAKDAVATRETAFVEALVEKAG